MNLIRHRVSQSRACERWRPRVIFVLKIFLVTFNTQKLKKGSRDRFRIAFYCRRFGIKWPCFKSDGLYRSCRKRLIPHFWNPSRHKPSRGGRTARHRWWWRTCLEYHCRPCPGKKTFTYMETFTLCWRWSVGTWEIISMIINDKHVQNLRVEKTRDTKAVLRHLRWEF